MNDSWDPVEDMLRRYRPRSVSSAKRQQIAEQVAAIRTRRLVKTSVGTVAAAMAGCLLVGMLIHTGAPSPEVHSGKLDPVAKQTSQVLVVDAPVPSERLAPTLWVYRRAAEGSLEELDSLLVRHADELLTPEHGSIVALQRRFP